MSCCWERWVTTDFCNLLGAYQGFLLVQWFTYYPGWLANAGFVLNSFRRKKKKQGKWLRCQMHCLHPTFRLYYVTHLIKWGILGFLIDNCWVKLVVHIFVEFYGTDACQWLFMRYSFVLLSLVIVAKISLSSVVGCSSFNHARSRVSKLTVMF